MPLRRDTRDGSGKSRSPPRRPAPPKRDGSKVAHRRTSFHGPADHHQQPATTQLDCRYLGRVPARTVAAAPSATQIASVLKQLRNAGAEHTYATVDIATVPEDAVPPVNPCDLTAIIANRDTGEVLVRLDQTAELLYGAGDTGVTRRMLAVRSYNQVLDEATHHPDRPRGWVYHLLQFSRSSYPKFVIKALRRPLEDTPASFGCPSPPSGGSSDEADNDNSSYLRDRAGHADYLGPYPGPVAPPRRTASLSRASGVTHTHTTLSTTTADNTAGSPLQEFGVGLRKAMPAATAMRRASDRYKGAIETSGQYFEAMKALCDLDDLLDLHLTPATAAHAPTGPRRTGEGRTAAPPPIPARTVSVLPPTLSLSRAAFPSGTAPPNNSTGVAARPSTMPLRTARPLPTDPKLKRLLDDLGTLVALGPTSAATARFVDNGRGHRALVIT